MIVLPMTELLSEPKAQIQGGPFGTVNLQNDQFEEKYLGRNEAFAKVDCLLSFGSSKAKICTVEWSEATHKHVEL